MKKLAKAPDFVPRSGGGHRVHVDPSTKRDDPGLVMLPRAQDL